VRPTLEELNSFVLLLDKMLSDNINKAFFGNDVPCEVEVTRKDGKIQIQAKGSLQILDDWVRKHYATEDWTPWETSMATFRTIRKRRQSPAHAVNENRFDQRYLKEQRDLITNAYSAVRTLRMMIESHPAVRASTIEIPDWLNGGKIWVY
jgi:hypothetical protein